MPNIRWAFWIAGLWLALLAMPLPAAPSPGARADGKHLIDVWETEDGLPQNSIIAITQTRDGYLWLGTVKGLVRFDGSRFTVFDEGNTPELGGSPIVRLFEDSRRNLWIGTDNAGTAVLRDGQVQRPAEIGLGGRERRLLAACEDAEGAVWLYNANGEIWRFFKGQFNPLVLTPNDPGDCPAIIAESSGQVWVGTGRRCCAIGPVAGDGSIQPVPVVEELPVQKLDFLLASQQGGFWRLADGRIQKWRNRQLERDGGPYPWGSFKVTSACEDRDGNLVVGTLGAGLFWFDATGKATTLSTNEGLSHNLVLAVHRDFEGNVWVGTDGGGLNRVKRKEFQTLAESRGMVVQSVTEDQEGDLWFGSNAGIQGSGDGGVSLWKMGRLQRYLVNFPIRAVLALPQDKVWAGTLGAGLFEFEGDGLPRLVSPGIIPPFIQAIFRDKGGLLWLGTQNGLISSNRSGWTVFTTRDGLSSEAIRAIADDAEGNLWVGTAGGGLNRRRDGKFTALRKSDGLPSDNISALLMDADSVLWIATDGGGLARWQDGKFTRYSTREGLASNNTGYLLEDEMGNLWIGSNAGLMRVPKKALNDFARGLTNSFPCRVFGKADGLPTGECTTGSQPGACRTRDGRLWFPTIKGLVSVNPAQLKPNQFPPPVTVESVLIDGQTQITDALGARLPQTVLVPADKERLEIQFTALNLAAPDRARFRYRLHGHETAWTDAGNTRVVRYSKLPPGDYRFQVTASNEDGVWNETGSSLAITVLPPFWRKWWFLTGAGGCLIGAIVGAVHFVSTQRLKRQVERLRQQEELERERARIARDLHDQLGASLTQVSLLGELVESDKDSPPDVEAHAQQISRTARDTTRVLDEIVWAVNPSNDTLDSLITYVCKYAQEYLAVAGLRYRIDVPAELPATPIPPEVRHNVFLAAKEAITNVVRHAHATEGRLRLRLGPDRFTLEIADNGRGVAGLDPDAPRTRNGLRNMRQRMEDIGGSFSIKPDPDGGAIVSLTSPLVAGRNPAAPAL